jgi:hypothetical protein
MDVRIRDELIESSWSEDEASDLAELAAEIAALPPVEPDAEWLAASRDRLLARFDRQVRNEPGG